MKKISLILFFLVHGVVVHAQKMDSIPTKTGVQEIQEVSTDRNYMARYNRELERVRKIYPYALHAKALLLDFDKDLAEIEKKRLQKKYNKKAHQILKDDYNYLIRDLYTSEGILLMKLIHRETEMTVAEIIQKYRGKFRSDFYEQMGKIWDQDLDIHYDPKGADQLTERIIKDIENNTVAFQNEAKIITKEEFKINQKEYKARKKRMKKAMRIQKRKASDAKEKPNEN